MMQWTISPDRTAYETERYNFFLMVEERGRLRLEPYDDGADDPNMTIGVGMNLRVLPVSTRDIGSFISLQCPPVHP